MRSRARLLVEEHWGLVVGPFLGVLRDDLTLGHIRAELRVLPASLRLSPHHVDYFKAVGLGFVLVGILEGG